MTVRTGSIDEHETKICALLRLCCGADVATASGMDEANVRYILPSFDIPFLHVGVMDPQVEWNFLSLIVGVVAPVTAMCVFLMQDSDGSYKDTHE
jgi:hypothetical protein